MTWILILVFYTNTSLAIPGYESKEVCEQAGKYARQTGIRLVYMCVPGPTIGGLTNGDLMMYGRGTEKVAPSEIEWRVK